MTCNKTQRRTHRVKAGKSRESRQTRETSESSPIVCCLSLDYNEKWHLTTKIYLANAFLLPALLFGRREKLCEITIAKVACPGSPCPSAGVRHPDSSRSMLVSPDQPHSQVFSVSVGLCVNAEVIWLINARRRQFWPLIARSHRQSRSMQVAPKLRWRM